MIELPIRPMPWLLLHFQSRTSEFQFLSSIFSVRQLQNETPATVCVSVLDRWRFGVRVLYQLESDWRLRETVTQRRPLRIRCPAHLRAFRGNGIFAVQIQGTQKAIGQRSNRESSHHGRQGRRSAGMLCIHAQNVVTLS